MPGTPHEVVIFTVEEVLRDIYGELDSVEIGVATEAFGEWLRQYNAHYYTAKGSQSDVIVKAILSTIKAGKNVVVVSSPDDDENPRSDNYEAGYDF